MAATPRTFRVFVSSTFSDLRAERDALQRHVWPALSRLCQQHGARFQAIDLRWGVSEEAAFDQQTMPICLSEIARCRDVSPRPNFMLLLGDRYGWRPLPATIPASELEQILPTISEAERARLVWSAEQPAGQRGWYRRDDNAVPPEYVLLPRERGSRYADPAVWGEVERDLLAILEQATHSLGLEAIDRLKYGAAATEQEIYAGALHFDRRAEGAAQHVHTFLRTIDGLPERVRPLPADDPARDFADYGPDGTREQSTAERQVPRDRLDRLKQLLHGLFPERERERNIHVYRARWLGPTEGHTGPAVGTARPISLDHLDQLCLDACESLARTILTVLAAEQQVDPQIAEERAHDDFRKQRAEVFVGRAEARERIAAYLVDDPRDDHRPLLVHGASGSGKSALLARAATAAWDDRGGPPYDASSLLLSGITPLGTRMVVRFIGATPGSSDVRTLLQSICQQLARDYGAGQTAVPADFNSLVADFRTRLEAASAAQPLVIFIDALDQLGEADNARALTWLPTDLPPHVRIVISAVSNPGSLASDCYEQLASRLQPSNRVRIESLAGAEADQLLSTWLSAASRTLDGGRPRTEVPDGQRAEVLGHQEASGLPIYLQLAFEAARRWRSFTEMDGSTRLSVDAPGLIRDLFRRLAQDDHHGPVLVERSLSLLAAARDGLAEDELLALLSPVSSAPGEELQALSEPAWRELLKSGPDWAVLADFHERAPLAPRVAMLPVALWSRLALDLRPYLAERSGDGASLLNFYHRQFREVVVADYLTGQAAQERHRQLATFFVDQPIEVGQGGATGGIGPTSVPGPPTPLDDAIRELLAGLVAANGLHVADGGRGSTNLRKLSELPYQQTLAGDWEGVFTTLSDFTFLEQKTATGRQTYTDANGVKTTTYTGVFDLQADYQLALRHWPNSDGAVTSDGPDPVVVTATDFHDGDGYSISCPVCLVRYSLVDSWLGAVRDCPNTDVDGQPCRGRWRVNLFTAPPRPGS